MSNPESSGDPSVEKVNQKVATYECHCGATITFPERKWGSLVYVKNKLGFTNIGEFINHNRSCCNRPEYISVDEGVGER